MRKSTLKKGPCASKTLKHCYLILKINKTKPLKRNKTKNLKKNTQEKLNTKKEKRKK